jgi:peptidoglycan hydrolase CwlO-like protein
MSSEAVESQVHTDVVVSKEELERLKLELEIRKLKDPWWKNPAYILAALPTMLAVLTLIYGFTNGYFQAMAVKLENQKHDLQVEKDKLQAEVEDKERKVEEVNDRLGEVEKEWSRVEEQMRNASPLSKKQLEEITTPSESKSPRKK